MENILSQLTADDLDIKLTSEKLFITSASSHEAFALRSINGIGVIDLVDDYNKELTDFKSGKFGFWGIVGFFGLCGILGLYLQSILVVLLSAIMVSYCLWAMDFKEPKLMSVLRIMMSGGNRDFKFDKTGVKGGNVAEFVEKVESTLTAFHKNNN